LERVPYHIRSNAYNGILRLDTYYGLGSAEGPYPRLGSKMENNWASVDESHHWDLQDNTLYDTREPVS
jgi:hypothetical protein